LAFAVAGVIAVTPALSSAKPKKPKDSGGTMTFSPEDTGQTPSPAEPAPAEPAATTKKKKKGADAAPAVAQASDDKSAGPASKTLEHALKLYEGEDYYSSTIELNKVVEG